MKVLVVGAGGREHALAWKIAASPNVEKVFCAPGNAGIESVAECVPIKADDIDRIVDFAAKEKPDLVMVGPEAPLVLGLADELEKRGTLVFACSKQAAELEGSKAFAKELMKKHGIPTGGFGVFTKADEARDYVKSQSRPLVVKADGLAAGKGVIVCDSAEEALAAIDQVMVAKDFGAAGDKVVVEERLFGEEASFLAFTDGDTVLPMASSQDHKAIFDHDKGPNTGGMGAYSPAPVVTSELHEQIMSLIMMPTVKAMKAEGRPYKGVLYAGLMMTDKGPQVLEFNARFGDPETQPLLFRMKSDIVDLLLSCASQDGSLIKMEIEWGDPTVCVVMASKGYPGKYDKGHEIKGLDKAGAMDNTYVFHAGTAKKDGKIVTSGGRVLGVTASGPDVAAAIENAYRAVKAITWEGAYFRTDIGKKALERK